MHVVGYPKSGNTWLCFLLAYCLNAEYDDLDAPGIHPTNDYQRRYVKGGLAHRSYQNQVGQILKTHRLNIQQPGKKPLIYLIRDGRDVMVSYYFYHRTYINTNSTQKYKNWLRKIRNWSKSNPAKDCQDFAVFLEKYTDEWVIHVTTWLNRQPTAVISYEDLKTAPEATLNTLFQNLNVEVAPETIQQALAIFNFKQLAKRREGEEDRSSFFRKGIVGDWQNHFSAQDLQFFTEKTREILTQTGYEI